MNNLKSYVYSVNLNSNSKPVNSKSEVVLTDKLNTVESKAKNIVSNKTEMVKIETLKTSEIKNDGDGSPSEKTKVRDI